MESARVINAIDPDYVGLLTLMLEKNTPLYEKTQTGYFELLTPLEIMLETKGIIENLQVTNCIFRSNHASNYLTLSGTLPMDKTLLLAQIENALSGKINFKSEHHREL